MSQRLSKVLKILLGLCKENVGQRYVGTYCWTVKVRLIIAFGSVMQDLAGVGAVLIA